MKVTMQREFMMTNNRNDFTLRLLEDANIHPGMHVLDVGCGPGEVTGLIAALVGDSGKVTGIDTNTQLLNLAKQNHNGENIEYREADIYDLPEDLGTFDAIVGRRVLMYLPEPMQALENLKPFLKTDGMLIFQESDAINGGTGGDSLPRHQQAIQWIWQTVGLEGGDIHIGEKLYDMYIQLGNENPHVMAEVVVQTSKDNDLAWLVEVMLPRMQSHQVLSNDFSLDAFKKELQVEADTTNTAFIRDTAFGIWGQFN